MSSNEITPFQEALDAVEALPFEDQQSLLEVIQRRLLERRRMEIAENARETLQAIREGRARSGTIDDLRQDLVDQT